MRRLYETKKYRSLGHADIACIFIKNGFNIEDAICDSAKYFVKKLEELSKIK